MLLTYGFIAIGSALGGMLRFWMAVIVAEKVGEAFPWGTLLINIIGSFIIGFFFTLTADGEHFAVSQNLRYFVMVGLCGGFTTFSAFSLQTLNLMREGDFVKAGANTLFSVILCLIAVGLGHFIAATILQQNRG